MTLLPPAGLVIGLYEWHSPCQRKSRQQYMVYTASTVQVEDGNTLHSCRVFLVLFLVHEGDRVTG